MSKLKYPSPDEISSQGRVENNSQHSIEPFLFIGKRDIIKGNFILYILYAIYEYCYLYNHDYIQRFLNYEISIAHKVNQVTKDNFNAISTLLAYFSQCISSLNTRDFHIELKEAGPLMAAAMSLLDVNFPQNIYNGIDPILSTLCSISSFLTINIHIMRPRMHIRFGNFVSLSLYLKYSPKEFYVMYPACYDENILEQIYFTKNIDKILHCGHSFKEIMHYKAQTIYQRIQFLNSCVCHCDQPLYNEEKREIQRLILDMYGRKNCATCVTQQESLTVRCRSCGVGYCSDCAGNVVQLNKKKCYICGRIIQYRLPVPTNTIEMQKNHVERYSGIKKECTDGCTPQKELVYLCKCGNLRYGVAMVVEKMCEICKMLPKTDNDRCLYCNSILNR